MYLATGDDPTNEIARTKGCLSKASTHSRSPWITLRTPEGSPAFCSNSISRIPVRGTFSLGFKIKVFPQAIAKGNIHIGTKAGKL